MSGLLRSVLEDLNRAMDERPSVPVLADELARIAIYAKAERFLPYVPALTDTLRRYAIDTPLRCAHFIAQVMHESAEFRYLEEIASGEAYEGRVDLGNTQPGDGRRYKGRGLIQLTGHANYRRYTEYARPFGAPDFEAHPDKIKSVPWCVDSAGWFWSVYKNLNALADADDLLAITRKINGGLNGIEDRRIYLGRAKRVLEVEGGEA